MKRAEQVTFGGSGLDRAAHLRTETATLDQLWGAADVQIVLLWRGKPLCVCKPGHSDAQGLAYLQSDHALVAGRRNDALFLGRNAQGAGYFAVSLDDWEPEDLDASSLNSFLDPSEQRHPDLPEAYAFMELRRMMTHLSAREAELAGHASRVEQAGWQRRCPSCNAPHFPRTDPVVIMLITRGDRVLLGRSPGWPEGMYSLLAGFVEPGETLEAAVRREVYEETGVKVGEVGYLASQPWAFPMSLMFGCYGVAVSEDITLDPQEIEEAFWLTRQEVMDAIAGNHPKVRAPRKGAIAGFLLENWVADTLE